MVRLIKKNIVIFKAIGASTMAKCRQIWIQKIMTIIMVV